MYQQVKSQAVYKFSVIMPCYNSEEYIEKAIESILSQSYPWWELIIVNDGSTDKTLEIISDYEMRDSRIKVYSKENGGYSSAVNCGLNHISGDYFLLLGSDDWLSDELFQTLSDNINNLENTPDCIAFRSVKVIDGFPVKLDSYTCFGSVAFEYDTSLKKFMDCHPEHAAIFCVRDTSKCFHKDLLQDLYYYGRYGIDADGIFSLLLCHRANSFLSIPFDGYYWTIRTGSVSSSISLEKHIDRISNWSRFFEEAKKLDSGDITDFEKNYIISQSHFVVELGAEVKNAVRYYRFIQDNARRVKEIADKFEIKNVHPGVGLAMMSPIVLSFALLLRGRLK